MVLLPMSSPFSRGLHFCRTRRTTYTMDGFCLLYLLLILLMRSGDVETNPGPNTAESKHVDPGISEMELHNLAENLGNHTNLPKFALTLGLTYERWMQYKASNTRRDGRFSTKGTHDMLVDWKKKTPQVSQKVVLNKALKDAGFAEFAVWLNPAQPAPRQPLTTQAPTPRAEPRERSKKKLTMQDVTDMILRDTSRSSSPHLGRSSANVTPPVSISSEDAKSIQAQFASKVAMVASDLPESDLPPPHRVPPQPAPQQPQTQQQKPPQQQPPVPQPMPQPISQQLVMQPPVQQISSHVWLNRAQPALRQPLSTQAPTPRAEHRERSKKKLMCIQDPSTMQDVTDAILRDTSRSSSPHSGRSSANVTPPVSISSEDAKRIQAQFASKVAMVASYLPESYLPPPHRVPPQPAPQQPQTQQQQPPQQQPPVPQPMPQPIPQQLAMQPPGHGIYEAIHGETAWWPKPPRLVPTQKIWLNRAQPALRQPLTTRAPTPRAEPRERSIYKKSIIRLQDTSTMQDVTDAILHDTSRSSSPHLGRSSANVTPPVQLAMQPPGKQVQVMYVGPREQPVPVVAGQLPAGAAPVVAQLPSRPVQPTVPEGVQNTVVAATPVAEAVQPQRPVPQTAAAVPAHVPSKAPVQMQQVLTEAMPLAAAVPPSQNPALVSAAAAARPADDTDNNEGNGGQLTSSKLDSGSDQDDISFGGLSAPPEILARGPRAQRAYAEAAKAGTKKVYRTRLMLVGQERVGKTSLKKTLTGQGFDKNEAITDGVETANTCEISIEDTKTGEKMWSIAKKDDEYSIALADEIAKKLKMTPPQDQESLEPHSDTTLSRGLNPEETEDKYQKTLAEEIAQRPTVTPPQDQEGLGPHSDTTLVGKGLNLVETEESVLTNVESPKAKEDDNNMPNQIASLVEKTLKEHLKEKGTDSTDSGRGEGVSLSIWDFAGHDVYYTTHQVFLTWRAIYVIVFDLSRSLDSVVPPESRDEHYETAKGGAKSELTCLEFINFWLCSILAHAVAPSSKTPQKSPPIFIVGTHRESVKGDAKEKKRKIDSAFKKIRNSIKKKPFECHVVRKYYAIENSFEDKDKELILLKRHIEEVAMEEPYMGEEIPLRWLLFEKLLAKVDSKYMSLDQTKVLMQPIGINSERELLTMLTFYHDLGYVIYYGGIEDQQSLLRDMVILNPQWLIDVFKQVITILDPAEMFQNRSFNDAWTTLEDDGILEDRLIQHMWHNLDHQEALVQLMAKFDLICEAPVERLKKEQQDGIDAKVSNETEKVVKKRYYVPSRLTSHCSPEEIAQTKSTDFYVDFKGFLPDGLFHRLMARAVRWMDNRDGQPVNLFYRQIRLMVAEEHHAFLEMLPPPEANIKVTVFRGLDPVSDDDQPPEPSAVKEVMDFVTSTLVSLKQHWAKGIKYDVCILCPCSSLRCREKKLFEDCLKRKSLTCGIYNISTADIKSKFGMSEEGVESGNKIPVMPKGSILATQVSIADDLLVKLAEDIETSEQMEALGRTLGFRVADINRYTETNRIEGWVTCKGTRCMLFDWRQTVEPCDHYRRLKQALYDAKLVALADTHLKRTPSIPVMATQESIADELLFKLAEDIETSEQMEALGRVLGFKMAAINKYTDTNHIGDRVTCKGTRCMLFDWRQTVEPCDQHRRLKQALYDAKLVVLADTHLKRTPSIPACNQSTVLSPSQRAQEYQ